MKAYQYSLQWFAMITLTLLSYSVASAGFEGTFFVAYVLAGAFIKGQIIIDYFMKLKWAGLLWRLMISLWLVIVLSVIAVLYGLNG